MYPSIGHLFNDLFGVEISLLYVIQSFGFFVALAFLSANYFFAKEMKRKEEQDFLQAKKVKEIVGKPVTVQELVISFVIAFAVGYKLLYIAFNFTSFRESPHSILFSLDGNILGGLVLGGLFAWLKYREKKKEELPEPKEVEKTIHPHQLVGNMTILAAIFGILGAKVFHLLENPDEISGAFSSAESFFSGLTMYGGLIVGGGFVLFYAKKNNLKLFHVMDACAPGLMLAYGVGRIGCHVSGDGDWGVVNTAVQPGWLSWLPEWTWKYDYPNNVINAGVPIEGCIGDFCRHLPQTVWPTAFYEATMCIALFGIIWAFRKKFTAAGMVFSFYLLLNGFERFWIEKIRVNEIMNFMGMEVTQAEIISTVLFLVGLAGLLILPKFKEKVNRI